MKKVITLVFALSMWTSVFAHLQNALKDSLTKTIKTLEKYPRSVSLMLKKASLNMQLEQWQFAIDTYSDVLLLDKNNPSALYYRAYAYERIRNYISSRIDYEKLLTIDPLHFYGRLGLVLLNQKEHKIVEALNLINLLVESYPSNAMVYAIRAGIEKEQRLWELAEFDFSEALKNEPDNADYRLNKVECLLALGKKQEALEELNYLRRLNVSADTLAYWYQQCRKK